MESLEHDHKDTGSPEFIASISVTFEIFLLLLVLPVFVLLICSRKQYRSREAKRTQRLMLAVLLSNCACQVTWILLFSSCMHCVWTAASIVNARTIQRGINLLFLIHRAKLVQGMAPIVSVIWFNTILPAIVVVWTIVFLIIGTINSMDRPWRCVSYIESETFEWCWDMETEFGRRDMIAVYVGLSFDLLMTAFLMVLFSVPLYQVNQTNLGIMNENQVRHRKKLQSLLIWSVILTFVNQISSILFSSIAFGRSQWILLLFVIGKFDPPVNVWTSWLMITRNREYLHHVCCCWCRKAEARRHLTQPSAFLDLSSRNGGPSDSTNEMAAIELPISGPMHTLDRLTRQGTL